MWRQRLLTALGVALGAFLLGYLFAPWGLYLLAKEPPPATTPDPPPAPTKEPPITILPDPPPDDKGDLIRIPPMPPGPPPMPGIPAKVEPSVPPPLTYMLNLLEGVRRALWLPSGFHESFLPLTDTVSRALNLPSAPRETFPPLSDTLSRALNLPSAPRETLPALQERVRATVHTTTPSWVQMERD
ncbi:MAG: hypothetical protein NZ951_04480 [Dehalococcoidia bacterium]|nr:hypothetical protein [Dehalococcoidia bacterium]MDW8120360.1 hypothetical protein [Chloroflexota bacterium]